VHDVEAGMVVPDFAEVLTVPNMQETQIPDSVVVGVPVNLTLQATCPDCTREVPVEKERVGNLSQLGAEKVKNQTGH
jgi:hypothetical protein